MALECKSKGLIILICNNAILFYGFPANRIIPTRLPCKQHKARASSQGSEKNLSQLPRVTEIPCWTQRDRIPHSFATCTILYSCIECMWEGYFSAGPNKLLECSAQETQQDMANVLLGLSAAWYFSLHPFSRYIPNHGYWTLSSPGNAG